MTLLEIKNITKRFGGLKALSNINFQITKNEILGLIGPNGSGKSTLINIISGSFKPSEGKILFKNTDVTGLKPHETTKAGIGRSFQLSTLFKEFSVLESMRVAHHLQYNIDPFSTIIRNKKALLKEKYIDSKSIEILKFLGIDHVKHELTKNLPHGLERLLGIGMVLATGSEILLLDEPVTGMNPTETKEMMKMIIAIRERGIAILVVEHNMKVIMGISDRIVALNFGHKIAEGTPSQIRNDQKVIKAYLGE